MRESRTAPGGNESYRREAAAIGAFGASVPVGMVVTRPFAPGGGVAAAGWGVAGIKPSALRTSVSSFARTSLLSFRNWRAFSRPWPIRSLLKLNHDPDQLSPLHQPSFIVIPKLRHLELYNTGLKKAASLSLLGGQIKIVGGS